jgi:hypothetical protein
MNRATDGLQMNELEGQDAEIMMQDARTVNKKAA